MAAPGKEKPTFEQSIERLETLIESMESGEIPLGELVDKFEEGTKLLKFCQQQLGDAELKIEKLSLESGELEPLADQNQDEE